MESTMSDRTRDRSAALTEFRRVRTLAWEVRKLLAEDLESERIQAHFDENDDYVPPVERKFRDPDSDDMITILSDFIEISTPFAQRGKN